MEFLEAEGIDPPTANPGVERVAYHDACHALVQGIREQPRALLRAIPGLEVVEVPQTDGCCGAAGLYALTQPDTSDELMRRTAEAIASTGVGVVTTANPGCVTQLAAGLRSIGREIEVVQPVELLDRAYAAEDRVPEPG
jgi:glycolate oxidase iron-sulfur subunit